MENILTIKVKITMSDKVVLVGNLAFEIKEGMRFSDIIEKDKNRWFKLFNVNSSGRMDPEKFLMINKQNVHHVEQMKI